MKCAAVVFVCLDCYLIEHALDVFDVSVVLNISINLVASDDHMEFIDLKSEDCRNLLPDEAKGLEEGHLDLLDCLAFHVHAVVHRYRLRLEIVEACSDGGFGKNGADAFVAIKEQRNQLHRCLLAIKQSRLINSNI